jgi:peptidyl-prolyl cis-trans isomerase SurA
MCTICLVLAAAAVAPPPVGAEVIEEIVAVINGDIITKSDFEEEQQMMIADIYRRYTGEELDQQVKDIRENLLLRMIDRKILLHKAQMMYDTDRMGEVFLESFKEQQQITDDEELAQALAREGMTLDHLKARLIEAFAPDEVIRFEVSSRIAVGDKEIEAYYAEHTDEFAIPAEATLREIVLLAGNAARKEERRAEAAAIRERALAAEDFGELALEVSESGTKDDGGLLGPVKRGELAEQLEAVAFSLPVGEISELLETEHGFHILKVDSRTDDTIAGLDEVREGLRRYLEDLKYYSELETFMKKARSEADWCVKTNYADRMPEGSAEHPCSEL